MQSNILNIENWSSYKDEVGTHYTYKINNHYSYLLTESNREELKIEFINKIDDFVVNQYYINCVTENGTIGYPIHYCPICGEKLK